MIHPFSYEGRRVVVTGGSRGVGAALLDVLAELGAAHVTVLDLNPPTGRHDMFLATDLTDEQAVRAAITAVKDPVHALFNNAGVADTTSPHTVLSVNYLALRTLSEGLLDHMPDGGAIVNTASTAGNLWRKRTEQIDELLALDLGDTWKPSLQWFDEHAGPSAKARTTSRRSSSSATPCAHPDPPCAEAYGRTPCARARSTRRCSQTFARRRATRSSTGTYARWRAARSRPTRSRQHSPSSAYPPPPPSTA
jgi:NAD(P)-dependent dehydrogenase (short-subunit alcohol dehydrogenase family)